MTTKTTLGVLEYLDTKKYITKTDTIHVHKDDVISSPLEGDSGRQQWQSASGEGQLEKQ